LALVFIGVPTTVAQGTPTASSAGITLAASGLDGPRSVAWGSDGTLFVAQAGFSSPGQPTPAASAEPTGGLSGSIARIQDSCPVVYQDALPSSEGAGGYNLGPSGLAYISGQLYLLDEGGGASHGNPLTPDGIYRIDGSGSAVVVADIGSWVRANPVEVLPEVLDPDGDLTDMAATGSELLVTETNSRQLLKVTLDGEITRVADFSGMPWRPTGVATSSDGRIFVSVISTGESDGSAKVVEVETDGTVTDVWTGLSMLVDVAVGPGGTLFALEQGEYDPQAVLEIRPNSGRVLRQTGPETAQDAAVGIDTPTSMSFGPDQGLYVTTPALAPDASAGAVIRLNLQQGQVMTMSDDILRNSPCIDPTPTPSDLPDGSPTATAEATPGGDDAAGGTLVPIAAFAFDPASVTVHVGTTVTWTNNDTVPHTVTATDGSFNSGNLNPGESFSFTFDGAGTFDYICNYHPNMTGTIVVN
jgi:plastocyanin